MTKSITKFLLFFCFLFFSFFSKAQVTAPDEDGTPYTTCNTDGANATRTSNDLANPVNVGTIDDRSCYANYKETTISGTTWGIYNITDGSNNQDDANTLQPRIERSLSRSQETGVGSFAKFTGTVRILEVGDASGTNNDGTYIMQAKGKHTGGGGSADPAICLFLAKPVLDTNGNQVSFNIYREQINVRGGEGSSGRSLVYLTNIAKNVATSIELKVGFRQDPSDNTKKIHYADAIIGSQTFNFNIPEPERGLESGIRYGVYRVKGGRAQIRWANTTYQKEEVVDNGSTGNNSQSWEFKTSQNANGWVAGSTTLGAAIVTDGLEITWNANTKPKVRIPSGANINTTTNKILALTLINNSTEPIDWQVKYTRADNGSDKFFGNTNFDDTPASVTTSKTYYYDMTDAAWNGTVNEFEIQMRDTGNTNRDNASSAGSIIFQQIAFINEIPAPTITSVAAGDWTSTSIWDGGVVPTSTDNVVVNHAVRIKNGVTAAMASLSIGNSPGQLRVDNGSVVTVTGSVSITRSQDGMAFYAQSGPLGSFTYGSVDTESTGKRVFVRPRLPKNDAWSLISSPVANSRINEITHNNSAYIVTKGGKLSIASYNDGNASGSKYVYYSSASEPADNVYIGEGQGHLLKVDNSGDTTKPDYYQRGVLRTTFPVNISLSDSGNGFNLLGNPLMGFLNVNDAADATNNILRVNGSNGTSGGVLAEDTVWLWDSVNEVWITKNLGSTSYKMPGVQGFFVKAKSGGGTFSFTKAMQSTTGDTYLKTNNSKRFEVNLSVANKGFKRSTSIVFTDNVTTSFDNGYDSSTFGAYASNFEIYTGLVADNTAKKLAIQSLPNKNFENLVVPVGVKVSEETAYTFNLDVTNLPKGYKVFLEDRLTNTFARLDEAGSEYTVTLSGEIDGRFFIHTKSSVLSAESQTLSGVGVYKDASTLNVVGLSQGKATLSLFNMLGKEVYVHFFVSKSVNNIHLPSLAKGVYIVKLNTERGSLSKKIILD